MTNFINNLIHKTTKYRIINESKIKKEIKILSQTEFEKHMIEFEKNLYTLEEYILKDLDSLAGDFQTASIMGLEEVIEGLNEIKHAIELRNKKYKNKISLPSKFTDDDRKAENVHKAYKSYLVKMWYYKIPTYEQNEYNIRLMIKNVVIKHLTINKTHTTTSNKTYQHTESLRKTVESIYKSNAPKYQNKYKKKFSKMYIQEITELTAETPTDIINLKNVEAQFNIIDIKNSLKTPLNSADKYVTESYIRDNFIPNNKLLKKYYIKTYNNNHVINDGE